MGVLCWYDWAFLRRLELCLQPGCLSDRVFDQVFLVWVIRMAVLLAVLLLRLKQRIWSGCMFFATLAVPISSSRQCFTGGLRPTVERVSMSDRERIVLIGPLKAGKSTVGRRLATELDWPFYSLDRLERSYVEPAGFDPQHAKRLQQETDDWTWYSYRRQFFAAAVSAFLRDHPHGVLELGGGHPIVPDPAHQAEIQAALATCRYVILLIPSDNRLESVRLLNSRLRPEWQAEDWNRRFLSDNRFWEMATHVVHTAGKLPDETVQDLMALLE